MDGFPVAGQRSTVPEFRPSVRLLDRWGSAWGAAAARGRVRERHRAPAANRRIPRARRDRLAANGHPSRTIPSLGRSMDRIACRRGRCTTGSRRSWAHQVQAPRIDGVVRMAAGSPHPPPALFECWPVSIERRRHSQRPFPWPNTADTHIPALSTSRPHASIVHQSVMRANAPGFDAMHTYSPLKSPCL